MAGFDLKSLLGQQYMSPMQGGMQGAAQAIAPMTGYTKTPVSMGQLIGAAGGGMQQGQRQAQQQNMLGAMQNMSMEEMQNKMAASKAATSLATQQRAAVTAMAAKLGLPANTPASIVMEKMKQQTAAGKYGAPKVVADSNSSTGFSYQQITQGGTTRAAGEAPKPSSGVTIHGQKLETEEAKKRGAALVSREDAVIDAANTARKTMAYNGMARTLVSQSDSVPTEWGQIAGNIAVNAGLPMSDATRASISTGQMFQGTIGNMLAAKLNAATGPQTDNDAARLLKTLASLGNTPEAKAFLLDSSDAMARREIQKETYYEEWMAKNKGSSRGAKAAWNKKIGNIPLFGVNPLDNRPIFFDQFEDTIQAANPAATRADIVNLWVSKYGK